MRSPVGDMILEELAKSGMSQNQAALKAGMRNANLNLVISGKRRLTEANAINLEAALFEFNGEKAIVEQYKHLKKLRSKP